MDNVVLHIPSDLKRQMQKFEMDWEDIALNAIAEKVRQISLLEAITEKSKLTENDAVEIGRKIKKAMWEKHYSKLV